MKLSPLGLGCYFAYSISFLGNEVTKGFATSLVLFLIFTFICYFGLYSISCWYAGGRAGLIRYWQTILPPSLTAIATASGTACIAINIETAQKNGVKKEIAEAVIPIGINLQKHGAAGAGVIKLIFLFAIYNLPVNDISTFIFIVLIAILSSVVMGSIPGGGISTAILMVGFFGFSDEAVSIIIVMSTLFDIPATLLNSVRNIVSAVIVNKLLSANPQK